MPLPEAKPTPDKANIYEQFSNIQASDLTRSQLDIIRDPLFLNSESEDVLRRILLIGQATDQLSVSGPIPRTGQIVQQTFDEANEGDLITIFKPNIGEVWLMTNASSSHSDMVFLGQESSTGVVPFNPSPHTQVYLTSDMFLVGQGYSIDTGETSSFKCGVIRVR